MFLFFLFASNFSIIYVGFSTIIFMVCVRAFDIYKLERL